jgi:hypothetical protein
MIFLLLFPLHAAPRSNMSALFCYHVDTKSTKSCDGNIHVRKHLDFAGSQMTDIEIPRNHLKEPFLANRRLRKDILHGTQAVRDIKHPRGNEPPGSKLWGTS